MLQCVRSETDRRKRQNQKEQKSVIQAANEYVIACSYTHMTYFLVSLTVSIDLWSHDVTNVCILVSHHTNYLVPRVSLFPTP